MFLLTPLPAFSSLRTQERESLFELFGDLLGQDGRMKPLECVGTGDEVRRCLALTRRQYRLHMPWSDGPAFFRHYKEEEEEEEEGERERRPGEERASARRKEEEPGRREDTLIPRWCWDVLFDSAQERTEKKEEEEEEGSI